jgi:hypothetical protein
MAEPDPVLLFVRPLNRLEVRYMVTGSVASIAYGQPRLTHDVDVVIELTRPQIGLLVLAFQPPEFYCIRKLEYFREGGSEKHTLDIRGILEASPDQVDLAEVERLVAERGLQDAWRRAVAR